MSDATLHNEMEKILEKIKRVERHLGIGMIRTRDVFCSGDPDKIIDALEGDMMEADDRQNEAERMVKNIIDDLQVYKENSDV